MKLISIVVGILLLCGMACAEPLSIPIEKVPLPDLGQAVVWSFKNQDVETATTLTILKYNSPIGRFDLDGLYIIENEPGLAISYNLPDLQTITGMEVPLAKYISPTVGLYAGFEFNQYHKSGEDDNGWNDALDYGAFAKIIQVQF